MSTFPAAAATPMTPDAPHPAPVRATERIAFIDTLRGFALLGILPMNIPIFAFYSFQFFNPSIQNSLEGPNFFAWLFGHFFFEFKMMTIFSALFGAGIVIFTTRATQKTGRCAGLFYRRIGWLFFFGLIHAYLIWEGDILVVYAMTAAVAFLFRKLRPLWLILIACVAIMHMPLFNAMTYWYFSTAQTAYEAVQAGQEIPDWQQSFADSYTESISQFSPTEEALAEERAAFKGGYFDLLPHRATFAAMWQFFQFPLMFFGRVFGVMLLGMAALKLGVFTGSRSSRFYAWMVAIGYLLGLPIIGIGAKIWIASEFDVLTFFVTANANYFGSLLVAAGHVGLLALVVKAGALGWLTSRLASVGQMAFTNYIAHSVICATLFYGYGFGLWGEVSRVGLWGIVVLIWTAQLLWSPWWLARYRFGPLEWLWRSLTYWKPQPIRRTAPLPTVA